MQWALKAGWECQSRRIEGSSPGPLAALQYALADRLVLASMRARITVGRIGFFILIKLFLREPLCKGRGGLITLKTGRCSAHASTTDRSGRFRAGRSRAGRS